MEIIFFSFSVMAIFSVLNVVFQKNIIYSLLYLIIFFLSVTCIFFSLKLYFIGTIGLIIQTGAISVLFLFFIMIFNREKNSFRKKNEFFKFLYLNKKKIFVFLIFLLELIFSIYKENNKNVPARETEMKIVGFLLLNKYALVLELISILLLSSLIISCFYMKKKI